MSANNRHQFSTPDRDNDAASPGNCAEVFGRGGWWYWWCSYSNLNGVYYHSPRNTDKTGITWGHWHGTLYSLKATTMMIQT